MACKWYSEKLKCKLKLKIGDDIAAGCFDFN